jgi:glutamyl-tRNA(Gln) amidotransferase subunit D
MNAKPLDNVKIIRKDKEYTGIFMPNDDENVIVIKQISGYNIGIDKKNIKEIIVLGKTKPSISKNKVKHVHDKKKPTIVVLHTGGTIASKIDYESGGVTAKFGVEDLIGMVPEIEKIANIETELVANMMSEDMGFFEHQKIAKSVTKHCKNDIKGIIIGHGTDTLGYTAAALSFMLENINVPVLIVGSQRSSDRGSTDAIQNLLCAATFISKTDYVGVATCLHHTSSDDMCSIISGTKSRKLHTSRRDAFKAVNDKPIALVDYKSGKIQYLKEYNKKSDDNKLKLLEKMDAEVAIMKMHPSVSPKTFEYFTKNFKAIIIEGTGLGHCPSNLGEINLKNYEILKKYIKKGGIVAMTSQCIFGRVHGAVYTNLRRLKKIGVIYCEDMLTETAYMKMSWLLGNFKEDQVKDLMTKNLRGEINKRILPDEILE